MKNIILLTIIFISIFSNKLNATVQTPDLLIIEKDTIELREMNNFPLEFLNLKFRPFNYTRQTAPNTACRRGYQAIWKVIGDKIYLEKIRRCYGYENKDKLENIISLFTKNQIKFIEKEGMILANWLNLDLYELKDLYSNIKNRKIMVSDNWFGKKVPKKPNYVFTIRNGEIITNNINKNSR